MGTFVPVGTGVFDICYDDKVKYTDEVEQDSVKVPRTDLLFDGIN